MFKFCFSDRKGQIFLLSKAHFADVASSYIEKMQRNLAEKDAFVGRTIIFKHALRIQLICSLAITFNFSFTKMTFSFNFSKFWSIIVT